MLITRAMPSTSVWGAGPMNLVVAHQDWAQRGGPRFLVLPLMGFLVLPLMGSHGLSPQVAPCGRRAVPVVVDGARGEYERYLTLHRGARDFSDNGWIAFAAAEASRRR